MKKGFVLKCKECEKEIEIQTSEGHFRKNNITIFVTDNGIVKITCDCGNEIVL